ncbi:unnamed protein product [Rhodiola kirilowii]
MENDDGLDLGLGLSCGGSSSKSTAKADTFHDIQSNDGDKTRKVVDGFNGFRHGGVRIEDINAELSRPQEKFFDMLSTDGNKLAEVEENLLDASNKRKSFFNDSNHLKKHEYEAHDARLYDKAKTSHISITTTDEGSTAENEDVADSVVDGSVSRFAADENPRSNQQYEGGASSGVQKLAHGHVNPGAGQTGFNISSDNGPKAWINMHNVQYGIHRPNINTVPLCSSSMESGGVTTPGPSGHPLHNVIQMGPNASWDQTVTPGNISLTFGYSPVQSQPLGKEHPWGILPRPQQLYPPFAIRPNEGVATNSGKDNAELKLPQGSSQLHYFNTLESSMQDGRGMLPAKGAGKQHIAEEVTNMKSTSTLAEGISSMYSAIRPGIDADVKFDGTGCSPNLPWVSTKGSGPNGKTISGVTYRFSPNQIKIVCACHGSHMTPEDFVKHANDENKNPADASTDVPSSLPSNNPTASAQS